MTGQVGFRATQRVDGKMILPEAIKGPSNESVTECDMSYNAKNYTEQGGDKTVIGGSWRSRRRLGNGAHLHRRACICKRSWGVKASAKAETDTVPVTVDEDGLLYVTHIPCYTRKHLRQKPGGKHC